MQYHFQKPIARSALLALLLFAGLTGSQAASTNVTLTPEKASVALYDRISARDLNAVMELIPAEGFSELGADEAAVHHLDQQAFAAFFKSDLAINLHAVDVKVQILGDTAVVTGIRAGSITAKGAVPKETRQPFTMVWVKENQRWLLRHLHLSPA